MSSVRIDQSIRTENVSETSKLDWLFPTPVFTAAIDPDGSKFKQDILDFYDKYFAENPDAISMSDKIFKTAHSTYYTDQWMYEHPELEGICKEILK
ncbi:MAG: hypothetical protein ABGX27_03915, partial [Desulfurobacteriaceae bacterium]